MGEVQAEAVHRAEHWAEHWAEVEPHHWGGCWRQGVQEQAQRWYLEDVPAAAQSGPPQGEEGAEVAEKAAVKGDVRTLGQILRPKQFGA